MTGSSDLYELEGIADKRQRVSKKTTAVLYIILAVALMSYKRR